MNLEMAHDESYTNRMSQKIQDAKLEEIVKKLSDKFKPKKVYLFGSRAKGNERPDSDYDLFLIIETSDLSPDLEL